MEYEGHCNGHDGIQDVMLVSSAGACTECAKNVYMSAVTNNLLIEKQLLDVVFARRMLI